MSEKSSDNDAAVANETLEPDTQSETTADQEQEQSHFEQIEDVLKPAISEATDTGGNIGMMQMKMRLDSTIARNAIILSEILGPAVSKKRGRKWL